MTAETDDNLPRKKLEEEVRRYQWYTGYEREEEYDMHPLWAQDMREETEEEDEGPYSTKSTRIYDKYDPEHMWIRSDTKRNLFRMR